MKLRGGQRKYLLRKVAARHLPEDHLNMKKKGFSIPMVPWMRGELQEWAGDVLLGDSQTPFLSRRGVRQVWDNFQRGEDHLVNMISVLLSFNLSAPVWAGAESASVVEATEVAI
jgi:asparagine synthase (glutamine-hydrolysing)